MKRFLGVLLFSVFWASGLAAETSFSSTFYAEALDSCEVTIYQDTSSTSGEYVFYADSWGTPPYTYAWSTGDSTPYLTVFDTITQYCVTVTDALGCQAFDCATAIDYQIPSCGVNVVTNSGNDRITAWPYGSWPYTFVWSTGDSTQTITPSAAGTYCVTVTDGAGCVALGCVLYQPLLDCSVTLYDTLFYWPSDSVLLYPYLTGQGPFTYNWSTGSTDSEIFVTQEGEYCLTITSSTGCEASDCFYYVPDTNNYCSGYIYEDPFAQGPLPVLTAVMWGVPPYSYLWSTGETGVSIFADTQGVYCVDMTDAVGCVVSSCYYFGGTIDSCGVYIYADTSYGYDSLFLYAEANGAGPFTYNWSTGSTAGAIPVYTSGTYCVTITAVNGCEASACYSFQNNPDSCTASIGVLGASNGGEDLCAYSSGPGPYTYLWSTGETSFIINVTEPGLYCVTVVDSWGCAAETCYYYEGAGNGGDSCSVFIYPDTSISGADTLVLVAEAWGTPPFSYQWNTGSTSKITFVGGAGEYCVTVTDATGCVAVACYFHDPLECTATIQGLPGGGGSELLCAYSSGPGPYTYQWSTGETSFLITVTQAGTYCATVTDANGCEAATCYYYDGPINGGDSCQVFIYQDTVFGGDTTLLYAQSIGVGPFSYVWSNGHTGDWIAVFETGVYCVTMTDNATGCQASECFYYLADPIDCAAFNLRDTILPIDSVVIWAYSTGPGPYSYQWNTGETNDFIILTQPGTYCATVTDDNGCQASDCYYYYPDSVTCSVFIYEDTTGTAGESILVAGTPANGPVPFSYVWSTGETEDFIVVSQPGIYCVTFTDGGGCVATACYDFLGSPDLNRSICGLVYPPDSTDPIGATLVELYRLDNGTATLVDTQSFSGQAYFWSYSFDGLADGDYIVRAGIQAGALGADLYAPTYAFSEAMWDDARVFSIPNNTTWCDAYVLLHPLNGSGSGNGGISGNIHHEDGTGIPGITILLLDEFGNIIAYVHSDADGNYDFGNLPFGNYQVMVEWPGHEHAHYWVSLTADGPLVEGRDFEVENGDISTGTFAVAPDNTWKAFPNPATDQWFLELDNSWGNALELRIHGLAGQLQRTWSGDARGGRIEISVADLPAGLYLFELNDGQRAVVGKLLKQ